MVARTSVRLVWRHFIQSRMGDMSSKVRMPTPEEALPGREQSMKVSGSYGVVNFSDFLSSRANAAISVQTKAAL